MPLPQILRLILVSLTLLVGSCAEPEPEAPPLPADFSVRWGHGGGLSGQWSGRRVAADGTLSRWSRIRCFTAFTWLLTHCARSEWGAPT